MAIHRLAALALLSACYLSCTTGKAPGSDGKSDLDIRTDSDSAKGTQPDWRALFKPAPNPSERVAIQKSLDAWHDTGSVQDLLKKARNEVALGKLVQAEVTLREALRRKDDNPETALELVQIYIRRRDSVRAFEMLAQVRDSIRASDRDQRVLLFKYRYNLAMAHLLRNDRERANVILTDLIAIDPKFGAGYAALASSYLSAGKSEIAEFIARRGLDRGVEDPALYNMLGLAMERQGRSGEAQASFDRALQLNAAHVPSLVNRGALAIRAGDCKEGVELLTRALAFAPSESAAYVGVGTCQRRSGDNDKASASFTKAIELDPENAVARYNLATILSEEKGREGEAVRLLQEVMQSSEENHEVRRMAASRLRDLEQQDDTGR